MQGMNGLKVKNKGVAITSRGCMHGKCGYFSRGATLEIPFFKKRLTYRSFSVSFFFRSETGRDGFLSNSCHDFSTLALWDDLKLPSRSSLSIATDNSVINIKMNYKEFALSTTALTVRIHHSINMFLNVLFLIPNCCCHRRSMHVDTYYLFAFSSTLI